MFRVAVSGITLALVACLLLGVRYRRPLSKPGMVGLGCVAGFSAGFAGLPGPPVIVGYMAGPYPAERIWSNMMLFLLAADIVMMIGVTVWGEIALVPLVLGLCLAVPNAIGNVLGALIFNPAAETLYRGVAYALVAGSAILGLPFWG